METHSDGMRAKDTGRAIVSCVKHSCKWQMYAARSMMKEIAKLIDVKVQERVIHSRQSGGASSVLVARISPEWWMDEKWTEERRKKIK